MGQQGSFESFWVLVADTGNEYNTGLKKRFLSFEMRFVNIFFPRAGEKPPGIRAGGIHRAMIPAGCP
jgi:hypothetical protein